MALLANEARFFRFRVFFRACSFQNEVGDPPPPPFFFYLFGKGRSLPFCVASLKKKSVRGNFWARTSLNSLLSGATCCVRLAIVLRCVATCWALLVQVWKWSNLSQQHPTYRITVAKRTQHVAPNNVVICCVGKLRSFGRGVSLLVLVRPSHWSIFTFML